MDDVRQAHDDAVLELGGVIARLRRERKLKQHELAKTTGLSPSAISEIENGKHKLPIASLLGIASALGADPATFFHRPNGSPHYSQLQTATLRTQDYEFTLQVRAL
jgi:transcriptional regulator with XRE-family HTH domain